MLFLTGDFWYLRNLGPCESDMKNTIRFGEDLACEFKCVERSEGPGWGS